MLISVVSIAALAFTPAKVQAYGYYGGYSSGYLNYIRNHTHPIIINNADFDARISSYKDSKHSYSGSQTGVISKGDLPLSLMIELKL